MNRLLWRSVGFPVFLLLLFAAGTARSEAGKVYVGLNAEIGHATSTSDDAIQLGMQIAIEEINRSGGVLGGRKLKLIVRDNRAVPARAAAHYKELAGTKDLVAVFCGKFSSAAIESLPLIHEQKLVLLDPWAANDKIVENGYSPNYAFRLSLKDSWAVPAMMGYARKRGFSKVGLLLVNTSWGRNNHEVVQRYLAANPGIVVADTQWFNYGTNSMTTQYRSILKAGANAVVFVGIEPEGAILVREVAALPPGERLPIVSHWSVAGGDFPAMTGEALEKVDLAFVQTFDLHHDHGKRTQQLLAVANRIFNMKSFSEVKSPCGLAHAYDLTRILAMAIEKAGSTDRRKVRDALERLGRYEGLVRVYDPPFTPTRHEALSPENVFMARYDKKGLISAVIELR
ncbi:MAG TPA: ABC transporter substrate-binding protein [Terriglobales bacterium]|nr:ABC transporter substrate-binding protein [Terriglobales bacterium]